MSDRGAEKYDTPGLCQICERYTDGRGVSEEGGASGGGVTVVRCRGCDVPGAVRRRDDVRRYPG